MSDVRDELAVIARSAGDASAGVGPEVVTELRRRRLRRRIAQGAGVAVLAVGLAAAAGPVSAWLTPPVTPPAEEPTVVEPTFEDPTVVEPAPEQTAGPDPDDAWSQAFVCGAPEEPISALADPFTYPPVIGVSAPTPAITTFGEPPDLTATVTAVGEEYPEAAGVEVMAVVTVDGVVAGGGPLSPMSADGEQSPGDYGTFTATEPLDACPDGGGSVVDLEPLPLAPGSYSVRLVATLQPADGSETILAIGGPWAVTIGAGSEVDREVVQNTITSLFACGEPAPDSIHSLPTSPLALAVDLPAVAWDGMSGVLGTTGGDAVEVRLASSDVSAAIAGPDGRIGAFLSGVGEGHAVDIPAGHTVPLGATQVLLGCGPDGTATAAYAEEGLPPGTYTLWPYLPVLIQSVTSAEGETAMYDTTWSLVVANPQQITVG